MRGQTTLDFATGASIFLLSLLFVFMFVPGTLHPFTESAQEETVGSNRVADLLSKDLLAKSGQPYIIDARCSAALLNDGAGTGCDFDGATLKSRLDLADRQRINITLRSPYNGGSKILCWDSSNENLTYEGESGCGVEFQTGDPVPERSTSTVTARRIVSVDGKTASLEVAMW